MKHEEDSFVPEIDTAVVLPQTATPDTQPEAVVPDVMAAVDEAATRLRLDADAPTRIKDVLRAIDARRVTDEVVAMLACAMRRDEDVSNAEAAGYVRGRNESIDMALGSPTVDAPAVEATFPRYTRRSVWD
mgnify:CR=1 FL=1